MKFDQWTRIAIGQMVREHVETKYGSQSAAAEAWGCVPTFVSRVISGERMPTNNILEDAEIVMVPMKISKEPKQP